MRGSVEANFCSFYLAGPKAGRAVRGFPSGKEGLMMDLDGTIQCVECGQRPKAEAGCLRCLKCEMCCSCAPAESRYVCKSCGMAVAGDRRCRECRTCLACCECG